MSEEDFSLKDPNLDINRKTDSIDPNGKDIREINQSPAKTKNAKVIGHLSAEGKKQLKQFRDQGLEKRLYKGESKIHHDLYKLEVEKFQKDINPQGMEAEFHGVEHCHFYHSVDSSGKPQETSSSIAGHFHVMKSVPNPNGSGPPMLICDSGPMRWARRKDKKTRRWKRVVVSTVDIEIDNHRHECTYMRSQQIGLRNINIEAAKVQTMDAQQTAPVSGAAGAGAR